MFKRWAKQRRVLGMLVCLTTLLVVLQLIFFLIHYKVSDLVDSLVNASIALQLIQSIILLPFMGFIALQIIAYGVFISWLWFITTSIGDCFRLSHHATYWLGVALWSLATMTLLALNQFYFPGSFFASFMPFQLNNPLTNKIMLLLGTAILSSATLIAYFHFFRSKRFHWVGSLLLLLGLINGSAALYNKAASFPKRVTTDAAKPNVILIGLDSLRPDFTRYFGSKTTHTPHIDAFLRQATVCSEAYTPLARTFPAWISILTANYPLHHHARNNLGDPSEIRANETLPKRLRQIGYETIYATDEKRFSNITKDYGFDEIIGPHMGVNDFLLGGLSDFPMTNLLINLPIGRFLFPFNYGNRAATITYEPDRFLQLVKLGLAARANKPLFLAIHLCLSHWPFRWAQDGHQPSDILPVDYQKSVGAVDQQLGQLFKMLQENGLLKNSIVVLLSDHGTALGLPGDRALAEDHFVGNKNDLPLVPRIKLSAAPTLSDNRRNYTISTTYGQGTNVLSLPQYRVLLAFRRYGTVSPPEQIASPASLLDIAPTVLDLLGLPPLHQADGAILMRKIAVRPLFMETGDSLAEIETDRIYIEKVIKHQIGIYTINPANGLLIMDPEAEKLIIQNKQLAILYGDWILAHYPPHKVTKYVRRTNDKRDHQLVPTSVIQPAYFVLLNLKTGKWTINREGSFAPHSPGLQLLTKLKAFYKGEV